MHLRNILDIIEEPWFHQKPWILLGTGPSLDRFDYQKYKDTHNIAAIYSAVDVCEKVDIHFLSDQLAYIELFGKVDHRFQLAKEYNPDNCRYIATRIINAPGATPNTVYWEYDCDLKYLNEAKIFPGYPTFPCSNTSSLVAQFFGASRVRTIYTFGIDGGFGNTSPRINQNYRDEATDVDFDVENSGLYGWSNRFGINLIKL